jgi:hypothetical protein
MARFKPNFNFKGEYSEYDVSCEHLTLYFCYDLIHTPSDICNFRYIPQISVFSKYLFLCPFGDEHYCLNCPDQTPELYIYGQFLYHALLTTSEARLFSE